MLVDTLWNDEYDLNSGGADVYHPVALNLDILGLDAYMSDVGQAFQSDDWPISDGQNAFHRKP